MDTTESNTPFEDDSRPFVIEACGDTMWDDVLEQPPYNPALKIGEMGETALNNKDPESSPETQNH